MRDHIHKLRKRAGLALLMGLPLLCTLGCASDPAENKASQSSTHAPLTSPVRMSTRAPKPATRSELPMLSNRSIQRALLNAGVYEGAIDGVLGKRSALSIRRFQAQHSLPIDGKPSPDTQDAMRPYLEMSPASPADF